MLASRTLPLFDDNWLSLALSRRGGTDWVDDVVQQLNGSGSIYLNTVRDLFQIFPLSNKQKKHLKRRLESFNNSDHLGGVNELSWWKLTQSFSWSTNPIPAGKKILPDFHITSPYEFYCEVTTLNKSDYEKWQLTEDHAYTLGRILSHKIPEKAEQIRYGHSKNKPSILVIFDYTSWSSLGTQFYRELANFLLRNTLNLPLELTAIIYVERKILDGRIGVSKQRSAVYHNPNCQYKLPTMVFPMLHQYLAHNEEIQPTDLVNDSDYWFWL